MSKERYIEAKQRWAEKQIAKVCVRAQSQRPTDCRQGRSSRPDFQCSTSV